jgi:hypothetical protein
MAARAVRDYMGQFMQQSCELLFLRQAPAQQDKMPVGFAKHELCTVATPDRRAERGGKSLQRIKV